jgi:peptidoglycan/LPS O-acetylase OafA/YrhL
MTATTLTTTTGHSTIHPASNRQLRRSGAVAAVAAAVATTGVAVAADAIGVPITIGGEAIPIAGFAQLTLFFSAVGIVIASLMARRADRPRHTFLSTAVVLTALSFVPDVLADAQTATKFTLVLTHMVAAAIVIPTLASRLAD